MEIIAVTDTQKKITTDPVVPATSAAGTTTTATTTNATTTTPKESGGSKFETFLKAQLASKTAGSVSEEELFSALVGERIEAIKNSETAAKYSSALASNMGLMARSDGFVPYEDVAKTSLAGLRDSGDLTKEEADKIYSEAFAGAQLDSNTDVLYDDRGGAGDITIATAEFGKAMASSKGVMDQIAAGTLTVTARSLDGATGTTSAALTAGGFTSVGSVSAPTAGTTVTPNGTTFDGPNGFLFKPISENQKTLAVLLPEIYKGLVSGVTVANSLGEVLDSGASTGYGEEGTREKFSFSKPGGDYGDNLTVNVSFMDGTSTAYSIPDGSKRYD